MRQKADKLEKGKWYCDLPNNSSNTSTFLRFDRCNDDVVFFSELKGFDSYIFNDYNLIPFPITGSEWYIPTQEDIEKYNLNEE